MITDNLAFLRQSIAPHEPVLIAASKSQPDNSIQDALAAGLRHFGENRVQEAEARWAHRKNAIPGLTLHMIGPLQTNKVKKAVALFDVLHTLDRERLALAIHAARPDMPCFIQVNVGNEPQKSGISTRETDDFAAFCRNDLGLSIIGLMAVPPAGEPPAPHFQWLADKARALGLVNLSMGMSGDYRMALAHGATHIRIGSALFGGR